MLSILFGILLAVMPFAGVAALSWLVAILLLVAGAGMLALAFGIRSSGLTSGKTDGGNGPV